MMTAWLASSVGVEGADAYVPTDPFFPFMELWAMNNKIVALVVCILLPPLAVFLKKGTGKDLVVNLILTLLFWVPGVLHAIWLTVL